MTISPSTMPETNLEDWESELVIPDISNLVIEDDTPVDSLISEKQQRLLVTSLLTGDEIAQQERQRADRLAELLREQGINPDEIL
jgi:hypothetical protein